MVNKFIVFEGIDGSGSSTQAQLLYNDLLYKKIPAKLTNEPTDGIIGHVIKNLFNGKFVFGGPQKEFDRMMAYLFAADRIDHLFNKIDGIEKILQYKNVISTRYFYSSLVYHSNNEDEIKFIYSLNKNFRKPDIIFYLDISPEESIERIKYRDVKDSYENYEKLCLVYSNYKYILTKYMKDAIIIDGTFSISEIHNIIMEKVCNE